MLNVLQQRISYRIIALVWRTLQGLAPAYLRPPLLHLDCNCRVFQAVALFALLNRVFLSSLLPAQELRRIPPSQRLAPHFGKDYLCTCSLGFSLALFMLT